MLPVSLSPSDGGGHCLTLTNRAAVARGTGFLVPQAEEVLLAPLTLGAVRVVLAVGTVAAVAGRTVEFRVKVAFL